jgi:hypothetical protein
MKAIKNLSIEGKRWHQRSYGNTYHTVVVYINDEVLRSDVTYGYDNHYLQTAADLLRGAGYDVPADNGKAYALMTKYPHKAVDVKRRKDL